MFVRFSGTDDQPYRRISSRPMPKKVLQTRRTSFGSTPARGHMISSISSADARIALRFSVILRMIRCICGLSSSSSLVSRNKLVTGRTMSGFLESANSASTLYACIRQCGFFHKWLAPCARPKRVRIDLLERSSVPSLFRDHESL